MLALVLSLLPQWFDRAPLQPYAARSSSGEWTLEVKPSDPGGKGPMRARILHGREVSWSGDFPWTFEQAAVSDDGTCVGYANEGKLLIAVIDAWGTLRKQHEFEHTASVMHGSDLPNALGPVLVHPTADLALIRVNPAGRSDPMPWRAFRLSTGEASADVVPALPLQPTEDQGLYEGDSRVVGDTELTLVHWWFADYESPDLDWSTDGGVFALHDLQGKVVWTMALLDDYTSRESEEADDQLENEVRRVGVIVSSGPGNRFRLRHVRENACVEYTVERDESNGGRWSVKQGSREPWSAGEAEPAPPVEVIELVWQGTASLRSGAPLNQHPIHGVMELGFTEQGELELLRREVEGGWSYARLRTNGELVFERALTSNLPEGRQPLQFHDLSGDRWLIQFMDGEPAWAVLDVRTGAVTPAPLPEAGLGSHVASLADGGYLALLKRIVRSMALSELHYVLADGTVGWVHEVTGMGPDDTGFDRAVYFGSGIARTGDWTFAVLSMNDLTRIDLEKNVLETWSLEGVLGHDAGYMNGVLSDGKGGVLFEEGDAFHQVDAFGSRVRSFLPRRADGSRDGIMDHLLRVAPDGRLWTSDRQRLYRLDDSGVADAVLGPEAMDDELAVAGSAAFDVLGRALVQDSATRAVHVFDAEGRRQAICRLTPAERPERSGRESFGGNRDGSLWVWTRAGPARFDATGTRVADPEPASAKGTGRAAVRSGQGVERDAERAALNGMKTRPDGTWLASVANREVLPDGRRLLLEKPDEQGKAASVHLYTASGEPLHTVPLPTDSGHQLSIGPRWIVVGDYGRNWTLLRLEDERAFRFDSGLEGEGSWMVGQTPDGKTLLLLNVQRLELVRYELP